MTMIMKHLIALLCIALLANPVAAQTREIREVPTFQKISYRIPGKLFLRQGSPQKVVLEGDRERIEEIKTTVKGDRLIIGDEDEDRWFTWDLGNQEKLNVYITVEHIDGLYVSGSGNAIGETTINADQLDMKVSGSGSLELNVAVVNDIKADVSGSGDLKVKGNCKDLDSSISGSGRVFIANAISGDALIYDTRNSVIKGPKDKLIVAQGLNGYLIGAFDNVFIVCEKEKEELFRRFVNDLKAKSNGNDYL